MYSAYAPDASDMTLATPVHQTVVDESDFTGDLPPFQDSNAVFSMSAPEITPAPYYPVNAYSGFAPTAAAPSNYVAAAPAPSEQQYSSNPATTTYTSNASYSPSSATGYYDSPSAATAGAETPTPAGADQSFAPMSMLRGSSGTHLNLLAVQDMYASAAVDPLAAGGKPYHPSSAHYYAAPQQQHQQQHQQQQYPQYPQYQQQPVSQASRKAEPWTGDVPSYPRQPVPNQTQPYYVFDSAASSVMAPAAAPTPTTTTTAAPAPRQIPAPVQVQPALPLQQQARGASGEAFFLTSPGPISEGLVTPSTFGSGALYGASSLALPTPAPHTSGHATGDYVHAPPHSAMGSSAVSPYDDGQSTLSSASPSGYPSMSLEFRSIPVDASVLTSPSASSSSSSAASAASASALSSPVPVPVSAPIETMRAKRSAPEVQDDDAYDGTVAFPASRSSASTSASSYAGAMVPSSSSSRSSGGASSLSMQYAAAAAAAAAAVPLAKSRVAESRMPGNQKPRVNDKEAMRRVHLNEQIAEIRDLIQYDSKRQDKVSILQAASAALRALEFELATLEKQARRPSAADLAGLRTADPMAVAHPVPGGTGSALDFFAQTRVRINHRSAFELSSAPMCIAEVGGGFVDVNRALLEMWGYSREDLIGKPCCTYAHPDDMVNIVTNITQLFTGRHKAVTVMKRVRHASGRWMGFRSVTWIVQGEDDVDVDPATGKKRRVAQYLQSMLFPVAWKMDSVEEVPAASPTAAAAACGSAASGSGSANSCAQPSLEEL